MAHSIIQFFNEDSPHDCGYCSGKDSSLSTGMWAHAMTVEDYQDLINRNWRRSGCYCYHPQMKATCCPPYMIKCDVNAFKMGKHDKKIIKKFNRFLMTGEVKLPEPSSDSQEPTKSREPAKSQKPTKSQEPTKSDKPAAASRQSGQPKQVSKGLGADPTKPKAIKAKQLRLQKKGKFQVQGEDKIPVTVSSESSESTTSQPSHSQSNQEKSLGDLLNEYDPQNSKHQFELRLVRNHPASQEFTDTKLEEYQVYKKYQMKVHEDPESKLDFNQFKRFLIDSPLKEETRGGVGLGSFHYQYVLDGKIIAVEVMDILPQFISSKYFFYDPEYEFLTLGTYSTLRSLYFIQQLNLKLPSLQHYCMGYYIDSCPKMRYKGKFSSSYLLCPETYQWVPIEQCLPKLSATKYSRLCGNPSQVDADKPDKDDHKSTYCLHNRQIVPYRLLSVMSRDSADGEEVKRYTNLIGTTLNKRILLYREA